MVMTGKEITRRIENIQKTITELEATLKSARGSATTWETRIMEDERYVVVLLYNDLVRLRGELDHLSNTMYEEVTEC